MDNEEHFIGYEYKSLTVTQGMENVYIDKQYDAIYEVCENAHTL